MEKRFETPMILTTTDKVDEHVKDGDGNPLYLKQKVTEDGTPLYLDAKDAETTEVTGTPAMEETIQRVGDAKLTAIEVERKSPIAAAKLLSKSTVIAEAALMLEVRIELRHADGVTSEMSVHTLPYEDKDLADEQLLDKVLLTYDLK